MGAIRLSVSFQSVLSAISGHEPLSERSVCGNTGPHRSLPCSLVQHRTQIKSCLLALSSVPHLSNREWTRLTTRSQIQSYSLHAVKIHASITDRRERTGFSWININLCDTAVRFFALHSKIVVAPDNNDHCSLQLYFKLHHNLKQLRFNHF